MTSQSIATITLSEGQKSFEQLMKEWGSSNVNWNEAETRFHFIDRLLVECLGWPRSQIKLEGREQEQYADYLLGKPVSIIWEAKRKGTYFDLPVESRNRRLHALSSLMAVSTPVSDAIKQVQQYCSNRGVEFAVVCNGNQIIAFLSVRIGRPPLQGKALVFRDLEHMRSDFSHMWQNLSPDGIAERRLYRLLTTGSDVSLPLKPSSYLTKFPTVRYRSNTQSDLRTIAEFFIIDIPESRDVEKQFLSECYCDSGALSRDSLMSRRLLAARYAALFPTDEQHPRVEPASTHEKPLEITKEIVTEALGRRPIILLGDVGVGKTSFIKQLMLLRASNEFKNSINIYIDLGSRAALESDLRSFIIMDIEKQLQERYDVDIEDSDFVRGVYNLEVEKFGKSIYGRAYKNEREKYEEKILIMLTEKVDERPNHLRNCISHISKASPHFSPLPHATDVPGTCRLIDPQNKQIKIACMFDPGHRPLFWARMGIVSDQYLSCQPPGMLKS